MNQTPKTLSDLKSLADNALDDLTPLFLEHTQNDVQTMFSLLTLARSASADSRFTLIREDFFRRAHDMKGEGSTFHYPLLTFMGQIICDYLRAKTEITLSDLTFLDSCLLDVQTILNKKITGEDSPFATSLHQKWGQK